MSKCNFSFEFSENREALVAKAKDAINQVGGEFESSETAGRFNLPTPVGTVTGAYTISGSAIVIDIISKPLLIGCGKIEEKLKEYLGGA